MGEKIVQIDRKVMELIAEYNAQYANAWPGDPETTYDKILQRCNHNLQMVADHFEYADNTEPHGGNDE